MLIEWLERLGLGPLRASSRPRCEVPRGDRPNIVVTIPGGAEPGTFWIMTHMDIVPPGEARLWESDPYTMVVKGNRLIGRGVEDNQQSLVASVFAAACVRELGLRPRRTVAPPVRLRRGDRFRAGGPARAFGHAPVQPSGPCAGA